MNLSRSFPIPNDPALEGFLDGRSLEELLAVSDADTLEDVLRRDPANPDEALVTHLRDAVVALAEQDIAAGARPAYCLDARVLAAVDSGHQLMAWRAVRDEWLAARHSSLDGMYLKQRLAHELPDYELCNGAFCQSTKREAPPELAAEAARVGGEVRWSTPERRLVAAVKFPPEFRGTEHARWCIRSERSRQYSSTTLGRRGLDEAKWQEFVETFLAKLRDSMEISRETIQRHGAYFEMRIDVIEDDDSP